MNDKEFTLRLEVRLQQRWAAMQAARGYAGAPAVTAAVQAAIPAATAITGTRGPRKRSAPARPQHPRQAEADEIVRRMTPTWGCPFCQARFTSVSARNAHLSKCLKRPQRP